MMGRIGRMGMLACVGLLAACASGGDDVDAGAGAISGPAGVAHDSAPKPADGQSSKGTPAPAEIPPLSGGSEFVPKEVVVLEDVRLDDDGNETPVSRIVASTEPGVCDRMGDALDLARDEKVVSVWVDGTSFVVGNTVLTVDAPKKTAGASFVDPKAVCTEGGSTGEPDRGNGTLKISDVGPVVKGSMDITFNGAHITGNFEAKTCANKTRGLVNCPP
jgi:hypothetical protein